MFFGLRSAIPRRAQPETRPFKWSLRVWGLSEASLGVGGGGGGPGGSCWLLGYCLRAGDRERRGGGVEESFPTHRSLGAILFLSKPKISTGIGFEAFPQTHHSSGGILLLKFGRARQGFLIAGIDPWGRVPFNLCKSFCSTRCLLRLAPCLGPWLGL